MIDDPLRDRVFQPIADWYGQRYENTSFSLASAMLLLSMFALVLYIAASGFLVTLPGFLLAAPLLYVMNSWSSRFEGENTRYLRMAAQGISYANPYRVNGAYLFARGVPLATCFVLMAGTLEAVGDGKPWALFMPLIGILVSAAYYFAACAPDKVPPGCARI